MLLKIFNTLLFVSVDVTSCAFAQTADKARKQLTVVINYQLMTDEWSVT